MTASSVWLQSTKQSRTKHKDGTDAFCGQSLFVVISNLPRRPYLSISDGNADGIFVREKCEHFFRLNVCIEFRVSSTFGQSDGACPTHRRQWADFLAALTALPRRHDKTARTETRCHLLLKLRQMPTQTAASRGYVLFDIKMAFMPSVVWCRKGHTRILKLSAGCGHTRGVLKTWKNTDHRRCKNRTVRNAAFFDPNFQMYSIRNRWDVFLSKLLISSKGLSRPRIKRCILQGLPQQRLCLR